MKTLIIAEKPSVATDIARVIGGLKKNGDYYEGDNYIVGNALGHLLELACPEKYEVKRGKWTFAHLPVLPPTFDLKPISRTADKLKSLAKLIKRPDVGEIVNACDAGREGELIFRYIMQLNFDAIPSFHFLNYFLQVLIFNFQLAQSPYGFYFSIASRQFTLLHFTQRNNGFLIGFHICQQLVR